MNVGIVSVGAIAIVPICIAIVQALKMTGWVKDKYAPLASILVGVLIAFISDHAMADLTQTVLNGVMYGLSASGLYSGISTTSQAVKEQQANEKQKAENQKQASNYQAKNGRCE
jgi:hypothetical protein